jgi:protein-tyrosine-phosphatase
MLIHFICTGNIYRSRLAEAYCASKQVPGLRVSSSGIMAAMNSDLPIAPYTARLLDQYGLKRFAAPEWRQTTPAMVQSSDVLVFMEAEHHRFCKRWIDSKRQKHTIWSIPDIGRQVGAGQLMTEVDRTFQLIRQRTDTLLTELNLLSRRNSAS